MCCKSVEFLGCYNTVCRSGKLPQILYQSHDCVQFHGLLELVFKRAALCRSSHDNFLLLGLGLISVSMKLVRATCAAQDHITTMCYALGSRGSCPQHRGSAGQLRKFGLCQFPVTLQPVPKHRSCDFPQAVLKSQLVISSCRANCR